jgi:hypothetical protein
MDTLRELVGLSIGRASMCWSEIPTGVFDDVTATQIVNTLMQAIQEYTRVEAPTPLKEEYQEE